jgi:AcrR family transcriptional regulator
MARPVDHERRRELLEAATDYAIEHGIAQMSLRPLADALGTQAPVLLHHFGSKEQLVALLLNEVRTRLRRVARAAILDGGDPVEAVWRWAIDPAHDALYRTFFEAYGLALRDPIAYHTFLDSVVTDWLAEFDQARDPMDATAVIALVRGLLLDLLATGDRERVNRTFERAAPALRRGATSVELQSHPGQHDNAVQQTP